MNYAKMYALVEAEMIVGARGSMPAAARDAWMSACENAGYSADIDSAMYKAYAFDCLPETASFQENADVRAYFESIGFTY
jgi:hypothetical protein